MGRERRSEVVETVNRDREPITKEKVRKAMRRMKTERYFVQTMYK